MKGQKDYSDKISYYSYKVNQAITNLDVKDLAYYTAKLSYFMEREREARREKLIFGLYPA
jgi:hypothetical protein